MSDGFSGKPYDLMIDRLDESMYSSEVVCEIYDRALRIQLGELQRLRDFNL